MATYYWVGGNGTWDNASKTNWSTVSGGAGGSGPPLSTDTVIFDASSGTGTCTTAATAAAAAATLNSSTLGLTLGANLTMTGTFTLTAGALNLGNNTLTALVFSSNNSNTRSIAFNTSGKIILTGFSGTIWTTNTATNFSYTGTSYVEFNYSGSVGTRTIAVGTLTETTSFNIKISAGTDIVSGPSFAKNLDFTGFSGTFNNANRFVYGNLTYSTGMTIAAGANATTFSATSGTQQITTNGKTLDFPLTFNGIGGTFAFQDALTQGSTRSFSITNGTVQLKAGVTSTVGVLATSGTNQKVLQSTSAGSQATLSQASGNFNAQYLTVKDIAATGGAKFNALNNCITQGNNSGWYFAPQLGRPLPAFAF